MKFKVQKGYGKTDYVSIDETELEKAIMAQITGKVAIFKEGGTVSGNHIISIEPDFDKVEKVYNPTGEDFLPRSIAEEHLLAIENAGEAVKAKMEGRAPMLKAPEPPSVRIFTRGPTSLGELIEKKKEKE